MYKGYPIVKYQISVILGHIAVCTGMKYVFDTSKDYTYVSGCVWNKHKHVVEHMPTLTSSCGNHPFSWKVMSFKLISKVV